MTTLSGYTTGQCNAECHPVRYEPVRLRQRLRRIHAVRDAHLGVALHTGLSKEFARRRAATLNDWEQFERLTGRDSRGLAAA